MTPCYGKCPVRDNYSKAAGDCWSCWQAARRPAPKAVAPATVPLSCVHRGDPTGERVTCPSCRGGVQLPLVGCGVHGVCTVGRPVAGTACCVGCPDRADGADGAYPALLRQAVASLPAYPGGHAGRGVVTVAGGGRYFGCVYVLLAVLRRLGCTLPVEVWHLGPEEMDPHMRGLLEGFGGVRVVDADRVARDLPPADRPRRLGGWECKAVAVRHSRFAEVLFLDADQVPARDPAYLFDTPEYRVAGVVAWPDLPPDGWRISAAAFRAAGLPVPGRTAHPGWRHPTDYTPWETGQLLVDKARQWGPLSLWQWFGDHADFWYRGCTLKDGSADLVYGDKDTAYLAWAALGVPVPVAPAAGWAGTRGTGFFVQHDPAGGVVFQHRVQPPTKWTLHGENRVVPGAVHQDWCLEALTDLRGRWAGHPWDPADQATTDWAAMRATAGRWTLFAGGTQREVDLWPAGQLSGGPAGVDRWVVCRDGGESRLALAGPDRAAAVLGPDDRGNWCRHDRDTFLLPAPPAGFRTHPGRHEAFLWADVYRRNEYRLPDRLDGAVVVDVGGHCGIFARLCLDRGAARVVCVEPHPGNLALLRHNLGTDPRVTIVPAAVRGEPGTVRLSRQAGADHSGGWAVGSVGVEAPVVTLAAAIDLAAGPDGRVDILKVDCEASEWSFLPAADLTRVRAVVGEYHLSGAPPWAGRDWLHAYFATAGFGDCETTETVPGLGLFFARRRGPSDTPTETPPCDSDASA